MREKKTASIYLNVLILALLFMNCLKAERINTDPGSPEAGLGIFLLISQLTKPVATASYTGAQFVAGGDNGKVWHSMDGKTWTLSSFPTTVLDTSAMYSAAFSGSKWMAVGKNGDGSCASWSSDDGKTWTSVACASTKVAIAYGNNTFIAGGNSCNVNTSDGTSWTAATAPTGCDTKAGITHMIFNKTSGNFYATDATSIYSYNLSTWSTVTAPSLTGIEIYPYAIASSSILALGKDPGTGQYSTAAGAGTWTTSSIGTGALQNSISYGNSGMISIGNTGCEVHRESAGKWSQIFLTNVANADTTLNTDCDTKTLSANYILKSISYHHGMSLFVTGGITANPPGNTGIIYSTDGSYWNIGYKAANNSNVHFIAVAE